MRSCRTKTLERLASLGRSNVPVAIVAILTAVVAGAGGCAPDPSDARAGEGSAARAGGPDAPGDLGIVALSALSVVSDDGARRVLVHVLIENGSEADLSSPWRLELSRRGERVGLSECIGRELPASRVAHCAMWLDGGVLGDGDLLEGRLDRSLEGFSGWDGDADNDARVTAIRWGGGEQALRVSGWSLVPSSLPEPGEVRFEFSVDGAHLVWLVTSWGETRLLGGDPADGTIAGRGRLRLPASGSVALVARNSLGAFVYERRRVEMRGDVRSPERAVQVAVPFETATAAILDEGIFDVDENELILTDLAGRLAAPR